MAGTEKSSNRFEAYLQEIEARELVSRRRRSLKYVFLFALLATGIIIIQQSGGPWGGQNDLPEYAINELSSKQLHKLFRVDNSEIVVSHPTFGADTINSVEEYNHLVSLVEFVNDDRGLIDGESIGYSKRGKGAGLLPFFVDIEGERVVGSRLFFKIENYDARILYTLNFGNGVVKQVQQATAYTYPLAGHFEMELIATNQQGDSSIYVKKYEILPSRVANVGQNSGSQPGASAIPAVNRGISSDLIVEPGQKGGWQIDSQTFDKRNDSTDDEDKILSDSFNSAESSLIIDNGAQEFDKTAMAEKMPQFPGGKTALDRYLRKRVRVPSSVQKTNIQGNVVVEFKVRPDGSLSDFKIVESLGEYCDDEAIRVLKSMPRWIPGEFKGRKIPVYQTLPVAFNII